MSIKTAYVSKLGADYAISANFKLSEFQCKDGSDKVLYSTELLDMLEKLRTYGGFTVTVNSGYRTAAYNKKIGGASASQHIQGTAADIVVKKNGTIINGRTICCLAQTLGFRGIGYISSAAVHLDMRASGSYKGDERSGYGNNVSDFYSYFGLNTNQIAALKVVTETNTITTKSTENTEEEIVYRTIDEVPDWGKAAVQRRIDGGYTDGANLTESMVRVWVIADREDPIYWDLEDVPSYWLQEAKEMVAAGVIAGDGVHQVAKKRSVLEGAVIAWRIKKQA